MMIQKDIQHAERRPRVSVVSPVYNAERSLEKLIASLNAQTYPRELVEIVLVDNDSSDGSWDVIARHPEVIGLRETSRHTPGAPRNAGMQRATGEIIALVDADCWAEPDWLEQGVRYMVSNRLDRLAGHVEFEFASYRNFYELFDSSVNFQQRDFVKEGWCITANLFLRRNVIEDVGLLDPTLKLCEDMEFGLRASEKGKTLGYCRDATVHHVTRRSFSALFKKFVRSGYGCGQLYRKHGYFSTSVFFRKANYRPVYQTWRSFAKAPMLSFRERFEADLMWNAMRMASNIGNFAGYFDLLRLEEDRRDV